jgi:hypothetical protein
MDKKTKEALGILQDTIGGLQAMTKGLTDGHNDIVEILDILGKRIAILEQKMKKTEAEKPQIIRV